MTDIEDWVRDKIDFLELHLRLRKQRELSEELAQHWEDTKEERERTHTTKLYNKKGIIK